MAERVECADCPLCEGMTPQDKLDAAHELISFALENGRLSEEQAIELYMDAADKFGVDVS